ncbi:hypothetical protein HLH14_12750 [Acinetobacter sp. ANC 4282]|jgi:hypothetical protein|uniref:hypothetical protein n=1 Tax=Acinetobacter terrae TaxID=2731247 RepID=UPI00148F83A5|nr:hypothetical protein [Acinetobacter terrae]NNH16839.1 hypothetical protein [Acinetobacter terrae]
MQISVLNQSLSYNFIIQNFNIQVHPNIYTLIHEFDNAAMDFKTACECTNDTTVIIDKAITAVSRYKSILLKKNEFFRSVNTNNYNNQRNELSNTDKAIIQITMAGTVVLESFIKSSKLFDPDMKICAELHKTIYNFYKSEISNKLDSEFWYELKVYEFLIHTNVTQNRYHSPFFSSEEIEAFFIENRTSVLSNLVKCSQIYNPLDNQRQKHFFEILKLISSISSTYQMARLI